MKVLLLLFNHSVVSSSLWPHGLRHARLPCPSPSPGVCSNSCPCGRWCHPTISSSVTPFSCPQSLPASGSFPMSHLFTSGDQSIGSSISASVLPNNIQSRFPLGLTGLVSLLSRGLSKALLGHMVFLSIFSPSSELLLNSIYAEWMNWWMNMFLYLYLLCGSRDTTTPPFLRVLSCSWVFQEIPDAWLIPNLPSGTLPWRLTQLWLPVGPALQPYTQKVLGAGQSPREPPPHVHSPSEPRPRALMSMARACCFSYGRILLASTISWTCAPRLRVLSTEAGWTHRLSRPRAETPVSFLDQGCLALPHSSRVWGKPSFLFLPLNQGLD